MGKPGPPRNRRSGANNQSAQTASLLNAQGMGGIRGARGYAAQTAYALIHIPLWLEETTFSSLMIEGAGDVDTKFQDGAATWRHYNQIKDRTVNERIFREVLHEFRSRATVSACAYRRFALAARGFTGKVAAFVEGLARLRQAQTFFDIGGHEILDASHSDVLKLGSLCHLADDEILFILEHVHFSELSSLSDASNVRTQFKGRLGDVHPSYTGQVLEAVYKAMFELTSTSNGKEITRLQLEDTITKAAASVNHQKSNGEGSATLPSLLESVRHGTLADIDAPLKSIHALLDADPLWRIGVDMKPDGRRAISLSPRIPEATKYAPLLIRISPSDPAKGNFEDMRRELFEVGEPVSFEARVEARLGNRTFIPETMARVRLKLPQDAVREIPIVLRTAAKAGTIYEYYLRMEFRGTDGTAFGDNRKHCDCPVTVKFKITPDRGAQNATLSTEFGINAVGAKSAQQRLKYLEFMRAVAVDGQPLSVFVVHGGELKPLVTSKITIAKVNRDGLLDESVYWSKVVQLEERLRATFSLPEHATPDQAAELEYLWNLICAGFVEYDLGQALTLTAHSVRADEIGDLVLAEGPIHIGGEVPPAAVELFGVKVNLPRREVSFRPVWLKDREAVVKAVSSCQPTDLVFQTDSPVTIRETRLN